MACMRARSFACAHCMHAPTCVRLPARVHTCNTTRASPDARRHNTTQHTQCNRTCEAIQCNATQRTPRYSADFDEGYTSVHRGYISSPCRLRSTQWPPERSMGVVNSGNAPGPNSRPSACGRSVRSRRTVAFVGITSGSRAAQGEPPQTRLSPWPPRSPGPLGHPPRPSPSLVELRHLFGTFS